MAATYAISVISNMSEDDVNNLLGIMPHHISVAIESQDETHTPESFVNALQEAYMPGFKLTPLGGEIDENLTWRYPGDPEQKPILVMKMKSNDNTFHMTIPLYKYEIFGFISDDFKVLYRFD